MWPRGGNHAVRVSPFEVDPMSYRPFIMLAILGVLSGCTQGPVHVGPAEQPAVPVSKPVQREVTDFVDFTGRTDAVNAVDIRARVTGYLLDSSFKEGTEVKKGDTLFVIDPQPYQAQVAYGEAQVAYNKAQLQFAELNYRRSKALLTKGGIMQQEFDQNQAARDQADAQLKSAQATLETYRLNLQYTRVTSPITGQISRYYYTLGNLISQDQTLLTTVVSLDPMYVYFDMDEPTLQRVHRAINEGKMKKPEEGVVPVWLGISGEEGFPHPGTINFINNQVNPTTGSISVRGIFPNPKPEGGIRLFKPGMFVRIRLPIGQPHPALLVIDRAIASDQGLKYVYVLDADKKVQYRRVRIGALQEDGLRVVEDGLKPDDRVVVGGLQQVRPQMVVQPEPIVMPSLGRPAVPETAGKDSVKK